jgi:branched-chain amino acid transport system substrate-binding protein
MLYLNVPLALTRRVAIYSTIFSLVVVALLWLAFVQVKTSSAPPTIKIGLVAPFEGHYRSTGYEVLFAVKLALQARNRGEGLNGYRVELVALNDFNDPAAAYRQAQALAVDQDIVGVVGHFSAEATEAALPVYREAQLALVIPWSVDVAALNGDTQQGLVSVAATYDETVTRLMEVSRDMGFERLDTLTGADVVALPDHAQALQLTTNAVTAGNIMLALRGSGLGDPPASTDLPVFGHIEVGNRQLVQVAGAAAEGLIFVSPGPAATDVQADQAFIAAYQAVAGFPPGPRAVLAYDATNVLLDSIEQAMIMRNFIIIDEWYPNRPGRAEVSAVISSVQHQGITGQIRFDRQGRRLDAPVWVYQITEMDYPGTLLVP